MACFSPLKGYRSIHNGGLTFKASEGIEKLDVPCGQCLGCRVDRTLMWSLRITHEAELYESAHGNCFVTLTYREPFECTDEQTINHWHLPEPPTLRKDHVQKFIKRLRKHFPQKIRYFYCGEYGDESDRPHYHLCLFNVTFSDLALWKNTQGLYVYTSPTLEKLWPYGFSTIGELNFATAMYTAGYVLKKITGLQAAEYYTRFNPVTGEIYVLEPPYTNMSTGSRCKEHRKSPTRPPDCPNCTGGIGLQFFKKYSTDFSDATSPDLHAGKPLHKLPRYYETLMEMDTPEQLEEIKKLRRKFKAEHPEHFTPERLKAKYTITKYNQSLKEKTL